MQTLELAVASSPRGQQPEQVIRRAHTYLDFVTGEGEGIGEADLPVLDRNSQAADAVLSHNRHARFAGWNAAIDYIIEEHSVGRNLNVHADFLTALKKEGF